MCSQRVTLLLHFTAFWRERGFFPKEELKTFRALNSRLQGHPNMNDTPGVDMSTGSLGQGVSTAVGMALAGKKFNKDYRVYALLGDGEIEEGQVWEAAMFAGNHQLDNLTLIVDNNNLQLDGSLDQINTPKPIDEKFKAFKFHVIEVADGHDFDQLAAAFAEARTVKKSADRYHRPHRKGQGRLLHGEPGRLARQGS